MAKQSSKYEPLYFVELSYVRLLLQQLTVNDTLTYENLFTNVGLALYHCADSVVVSSNVTEYTQKHRHLQFYH